MPLSTADLTVYQGSDYAATVTILLDPNLPADLSGYAAQAQIRRAVADSDPVVVADMKTSIQSPYVILAMTHTQTKPLNGRYVWDLRLIGTASEVITVMKGKVIVTAEVTRVS